MVESLLGSAKVGMQSVLREEHDPSAPLPGSEPVEQMDLLPLSASAALQEGAAESGKRGVGRPVGSKNRSTEEWRNFILSRFPSPLIGMAEIASRKVTDLARELGYITPQGRVAKPEELLDLLKLQLQCMKELAPYIHSKMPMAIEAGEGGLINLTIGGIGQLAQQAAKDDCFRVDFIENETAENSGLQSLETENSVNQNSVASTETPENSGIEGAKATDTVSVGNDASAGGV